MAERQITLIVSEEKAPLIKVKAGVSVELFGLLTTGKTDETKVFGDALRPLFDLL